jgi:tetratricopeptide (TPR) repeat protein
MLVISALAVIIAGCSSPEERKLKFYHKGTILFEKGDYVKAALEFKNTIQIDPKFSDGYYMLGMTALRKGDLRQAYAVLSKAVMLNPDHSKARIELGKIHLTAGEQDKAGQQADLVLQNEPDNDDALTLKAAVLLVADRLPESKAILEGLRHKGLTKPEISIMLSNIHLKQKENGKAYEVLRQAATANPNSVEVCFALAKIALSSGDSKEAESSLKKIISLQPDKVTHKLNLAALYMDGKRRNDAEAIIRGVLNNKAATEDDYLAVCRFYLMRRLLAQAEQTLQDGIKKHKNTFQLRYAMAELYQNIGKLDNAIAFLKECLKLEKKPDTPMAVQAKNALAGCYVKKGDIDTALTTVNEALKENPKGTDLHFTKGRILILKGWGADAVAELRPVVSDRPEFMPGHLALAEAHRLNGEKVLAMETLRKALQNRPGSPELLLAMARALARDKDYDQALAKLKDLLAANPGYYQAHVYMAEIFYLKRDPRAEKEYQAVITASPHDPLGYLKLSQYYVSQGRPNRAIVTTEEGLRLNPQSAPLFKLLVELYLGQNKPDKAENKCREVLRTNPNDTFAHYLLGKIFFNTKQYAKSEKELETAIRAVPLWPEPSYLLSRLYLAQGKRDEAVKRFTASLEQNPKSPTPYLILGNLFELSGDHAQACKTYEQSLAVFPELWPALNNLAFLLAEYPTNAADLDRALALATKVKNLKPEDPTILDTYGWVNFKTGHMQQAHDSLASALEHEPSNQIFNYHLAMALLRQGDRNGAIDKLQVALKKPDAFYGRDKADKTLKELQGR